MAIVAAILDFRSEQFLIYKSPRHFLPSFKLIGILAQAKKLKIDFKDGSHSNHLGLPIRTILAIFDLQVTLIQCTSYQVLSQLAFRFKSRSQWRFFKMAAVVAILDFRSDNLSYF